jgi:glycogen synthase
MVMLGSGDAKYEDAMRAAEAAHPASFRGWVGFSVPVAHRIIAGAAPLPARTSCRMSLACLPLAA